MYVLLCSIGWQSHKSTMQGGQTTESEFPLVMNAEFTLSLAIFHLFLFIYFLNSSNLIVSQPPIGKILCVDFFVNTTCSERLRMVNFMELIKYKRFLDFE